MRFFLHETKIKRSRHLIVRVRPWCAFICISIFVIELSSLGWVQAAETHRLTRAYAALDAKDPDEAERLFGQLLKSKVYRTQALEGMVWSELQKKNVELAIKYARERMERVPDDIYWEPKFIEVLSYSPEHRSEAKAKYESFLNRYPNDLDLRSHYADFLTWSADDKSLALLQYEQILIARPTSREVQERIAQLLLTLGKRAEAEERFAALLKEPSPSIYLGLTQSQHWAGKLDEARGTVAEALAHFPSDPVLLAESHQIADAIEDRKGPKWKFKDASVKISALSEPGTYLRAGLYLNTNYESRLIHTGSIYALTERLYLEGTERRNNGFGVRMQPSFSDLWHCELTAQGDFLTSGKSALTYEVAPVFTDRAKSFSVKAGVSQHQIWESPLDQEQVPLWNTAGSAGETPRLLDAGFKSQDYFVGASAGGEYGYAYGEGRLGALEDGNHDNLVSVGFAINLLSLMKKAQEGGSVHQALYLTGGMYHLHYDQESDSYFSPDSFSGITSGFDWTIYLPKGRSAGIEVSRTFVLGQYAGFGFGSFLQVPFRFGSFSVRIKSDRSLYYRVNEGIAGINIAL